jgi:HEAT repeat protein
MLKHLLVTLLCCAAIALPQHHPSPDINTLLSRLESDDRSVREAAVEELGSDQDALKQATIQRALVDLVDRENKELEATPDEPAGNHDPDADAYWDGYIQYLSDLEELANPFINWDSSVEACIAVHEVYNPDSRFAREIASHTKIAMPCVLQLANSGKWAQRYRVTYIVVEALEKNQLDSREEQKVRQTIHKLLHDKSASIRDSTIGAIKEHGDASMLPDLAELAQTDPDHSLHGVRALAVEAIAAIKARQASAK